MRPPSDYGQRSFKEWDDLGVAINHIRRLDGEAFELSPDPSSDVMFELHRIAHRQFPWQVKITMAPIMRVLKVFGESTVEAIVMRELSMTVLQFIQLGLAVTSHFQQRRLLSIDQDYGVLGISREASKAFLNRITCSVEKLRAEMIARQSFDRDWLYTWNPLEASPLISIDPEFPDRVICPIPRLLFRRVSGGIFYDLVKSAGFDNPYGNSFQAYVGEVVKATCPSPHFALRPEESYFVGSNKMHGVDWLLSDHSGHLFIECKTKRLTMNAKTLSDTAALEKDLAIIAGAISQHYRNICDALAGKTKWVPDGLPVYPIVLTLEDWFILSPEVDQMLNKRIEQSLLGAGIPLQVLVDMPFTIASANEFEIAAQVIGNVGIASVMAKKTEAGEQRNWSLSLFVADKFKAEIQDINWRLFSEEWERLIPAKPSESI